MTRDRLEELLKLTNRKYVQSHASEIAAVLYPHIEAVLDAEWNAAIDEAIEIFKTEIGFKPQGAYKELIDKLKELKHESGIPPKNICYREQ